MADISDDYCKVWFYKHEIMIKITDKSIGGEHGRFSRENVCQTFALKIITDQYLVMGIKPSDALKNFEEA